MTYRLLTSTLKSVQHHWFSRKCKLKQIDKRLTIPNALEDVEHLEISYIAVKIQNGTTTLENSLAVPSKVKHTYVHPGLSSYTPRYLSKRTRNIYPQKPCSRIFRTTLFVVAPNWKKPRCPSTGEQWLNNLWYIYIQWKNNKKKWTTDTHNNMDKSQKRWVKEAKNKVAYNL